MRYVVKEICLQPKSNACVYFLPKDLKQSLETINAMIQVIPQDQQYSEVLEINAYLSQILEQSTLSRREFFEQAQRNVQRFLN